MTAVLETKAVTDYVGACALDPDRWLTATDEATKVICRSCPRRWLCAKQACEMPRAEGLWAGVHIPEAGRGRTFALRQLRSLAEHGGYVVRRRRAPRRRNGKLRESASLGFDEG